MKISRAGILNVATSLLAVSIALVGIELALRFLLPEIEQHFVHLPGHSTTMTPLEEHIQGVSGPARHATSSLGVRGPEMSDLDEYRILAIGGSTTWNGYLDQSETWTLLLASKLNEMEGAPRTWSGDIGRSGHTARSHVLQFEKVVSELPNIDAVVVLVGVNDLTVSLQQGFEYTRPAPLSQASARTEHEGQAFLRVPGKRFDWRSHYGDTWVPLYKRLALYGLLRESRSAWVQWRANTRQDNFGQFYGDMRLKRSQASAMVDSLPALGVQLEVYREYLGELADLAQENDVRLILITHPALWREGLSSAEEARLWFGVIGDFEADEPQAYFTARALAQAMARYNDVLLDVCEERSLQCLDLASKLPSDTTIFYDDVHFTEAGSEAVATLLARFFASYAPY